MKGLVFQRTGIPRAVAFTRPKNKDTLISARKGDFITVVSDGSIGQPYRTTLIKPQWYRKTVVGGVLTKIDGATDSTYIPQVADEGYRLVVRGRSNGVLIEATALQVVAASPLLIDDFETIAGYTVLDAAKGVVTLNQTAPVAQGSSGLQIESIGGATGFSGQAGAQKNDLVEVTTNALQFFDTVTALVSIPPRSDRQVANVYANLSRNGGAGQGAQMVPPIPFGQMSLAAHVSENSSLASQGAGSYGLVPTVRSNLPGNSRVRFDAVYGKAKQRPTIVLTFDDLRNDQPEMLDYMVQLGLVGTICAPSDSVDYSSGGFDKWSTTQTLMKYVAAGFQIASNGTPDDTSLMAQPSVAEAVARWVSCRDALIAKGFDPEGVRDGCYPNGDWRDTTAPVQITAMTGNGTTSVSFDAALGASVSQGWSVDGIGVPADTIIQSIAADRLSAVLSNIVPNQTKPAYAVKKDGAFYGRTLPDALQAAGAGLFRTTGGITQTFQSRFGFFDLRGSTIGASWTTASLAQVQPVIDQLIITGGVYMPYIHGQFTDWQAVLNYIAQKRDEGYLDVLTMQQLRKRDGTASVPSPVAARVGDFISSTGDTSVGQTVSTTLTDVQWYRQTLGSSKLETKIEGATSQSYTLVSADAGFRAVVVGRDSKGVLTKASALQHTRAAPILLASFDSVTGWTLTGDANGQITTTSERTVQGNGAFLANADGTWPTATKYTALTYDPSWDVLAVYTDVGDDPALNGLRGGPAIKIQDTTGGFAGSSTISDGTSEGLQDTYRLNGYWTHQRVQDHSYLSQYSVGRSVALRVDPSQSVTPQKVKARTDALVANARGTPTYVMTFDDGIYTQYTEALPILQQYGLEKAATIFLPTGYVGQSSKLTDNNVLEMYSLGVDIQMDGASQDQDMANGSAFSTMSALRTDVQGQKAWFAARGLPAPIALCYPNGSFRTVASQAGFTGYASVTVNNGSDVVTTTGVTAAGDVGRRLILPGVPETAKVIEILSTNSWRINQPAYKSFTGYGRLFNDGPFDTGKIQKMLAEEGIKLARTTAPYTFTSRFGFGGYGLTLPGMSSTNQSAAQLNAGVDTCVDKGVSMVRYFHSIQPGGTGLATDTEVFRQHCEYIAARRDAGVLQPLSMRDLYRRDGNAGMPV